MADTNIEILEIDGSYGEGGGSILRLSCAFAALAKKKVKIFNIRKNRPKPGLKLQHLVGLQALTEISNGILENGRMWATEIIFQPKIVTQGKYTIRIGTAGSVGLILQILQLACIHATGKITLNIEGGATFGLWAPTLPYLEHVALPQLANMGYKIEVDIKRNGFYPKGGARVDFTINPVSTLRPISSSEFGEILEIHGISIASVHLKRRGVADRQAQAAKRLITNKLGKKPIIHCKYVEASNPGSGICLWLKTSKGIVLGSDAIGEKRKPAEKVGADCARYLCDIAISEATVDRFFSDQIIPFMALAKGKSVISPAEITNHTKTNMWLVKTFFGKTFSVKPVGSLYEIKIENF